MKLPLLWVCLGGGLLLPAQAAPPKPDPLDPQAAVPARVHRSALAGYRPHIAAPTDWRQANDAVERMGGWRAYAREAAAPPAAPASSASGAAR